MLVIKDAKNIDDIVSCITRAKGVSMAQNIDIKDIIISCDNIVNRIIPEQKNNTEEENKVQTAEIKEELPSNTIQEQSNYTDAEVLLKKWKDNKIAFNRKYVGKTLNIYGTIERIDIDLFDEAYIMVGGSLTGIKCKFNDSDQIINVRQGQTVRLVGRYKASSSLQLELENCVIVE